MNPVQINNIDHADLRVSPKAGAAFGDAANQALVFPAEFEELQREFAIIFRRRETGLQAYALLGLDRDENLYLSGDRWTSRYVPASHQRGPFSIGISRDSVDGAPGEPMIHVDMDDPRVGESEDLPLFLQHGGNAPYLNQISGVLRLLYEGIESAPPAYAALDDAALLAPVTLSIDVSEDRRYTVPDVLVVDIERLAALAGEPLERLHRSGVLRLAILATASLGNVQQLIARKQALPDPIG
ncbi:SapC family protein [Sphingomonas psychrotolerans]|uniref:Peptide ABC transporter permease n=1 Tax=Sphingomonas psychrotolerans TaxID=1327635 RepID=A0A2K8MCX8_9SPHN|nr:SapC family protein [Sphingomonas psychrotolerans]ATY30814.1 peptide ABC transporter permease [Sphingomonas psychrotolerans]